MEIKQIRKDIKTPKAYEIYKRCMYLPTIEKFYNIAETWEINDKVKILAAFEDTRMIGILVIALERDGGCEIEGIAVDSTYQGMGIGTVLINYVLREFNINVLYAETDDDAVQFYEKCGFKVTRKVKKYEDNDCIRYDCVLER